MSDHMWVKMTYVPLEIEKPLPDSLTIYVQDSAAEVSEDQALLGCWFCHEPLTFESYHTECTSQSVLGNVSADLD